MLGCDTSTETPKSYDETQQSTAPSNSSDDDDSRHFTFEYQVQLKDLGKDSKVRVWFPVAQSNAQQEVKVNLTTATSDITYEFDDKYHNKIGYFEFSGKTSGELLVEYDVVRKQASIDGSTKTLEATQKELYLAANNLVPTTGRPIELLSEKLVPDDPEEAGKMLFEVVESHMAYDKSKPGYGKGDAIWACDSQTGNCTDFHSLFISLARNQNLPARFEIGFPVAKNETGKGTIGGYHCWAWFHLEGKGWMPVDISEADKHPKDRLNYLGHLPADRISFTVGRDIQLKPVAASKPLNYFVYPHVEVDGKVLSKENIELQFQFVDQP